MPLPETHIQPLSMRLLLLIAIVVGIALAAVHRIPLKKNPSLKQRLIREGKWQQYYSLQQARRLLAKSTVYSQPFEDIYDETYTMNITIGTPPQSFEVLMNLNTGNTWVPDVTCGDPAMECQAFGCDMSFFCNILCPNPSCCNGQNHPNSTMCQGKERFDPSLSTSFTNLSIPLVIEYSTSILAANVNQDTLAFGDVGTNPLTVTSANIAFAYVVPAFLEYIPVDGYLGLGPPASAIGQVKPPLYDAIDRGLIDPIFSVYLEYDAGTIDGVHGGAVTYGGIDTDNCGEVLVYVPFTSQVIYEYTISGMQVGEMIFITPYKAISEPADAALTLPVAVTELLIPYLGGSFDPSSGLTTINCEAASTMPDFQLSIGGSKFHIPGKNLVAPYMDDLCLLLIQPSAGLAFSPDVILGAPFMRPYCHFFDIANQQLGLAHAMQRT